MKDSHHSALKAILCGGFVAGTLDIGAASLINWLHPVVILHAVASGVLGKASFYGGIPTALLGLGLQWGMSLVIAAIYVVAAMRMLWLTKHWMRGGVLYGFVIFAVMNYVVVPLSAAWPKHYFTVHDFLHRFTPDKFMANLAAMLVFGLIVSFFAYRFISVTATPRKK
ncbi:MAG: hypothetical protein ACRER1_06425 [Gammaproteobacteria bacterium]